MTLEGQEGSRKTICWELKPCSQILEFKLMPHINKQILFNHVHNQKSPVLNNNQMSFLTGLVKMTNVDSTYFGEVVGKQVFSIIVGESKLVPAYREDNLVISIKINKAYIHIPFYQRHF